MIEYRVKFDDAFKQISFKGVPDIRVIVVKGLPVFAMLRLPTAASDGKANLHRGGVGVGIDIATGVTTHAIQFNRAVDAHPETGAALTGVQTPHWPRILEMASQSYDMTQLGYLGVDVILDRDKGPMLLELNARPGISIQLATRSGHAQGPETRPRGIRHGRHAGGAARARQGNRRLKKGPARPVRRPHRIDKTRARLMDRPPLAKAMTARPSLACRARPVVQARPPAPSSRPRPRAAVRGRR